MNSPTPGLCAASMVLTLIVGVLLPWEDLAAEENTSEREGRVTAGNARQWADEIVRRVEGGNSPAAREKAAAELFDKLVGKYAYLVKQPPEAIDYESIVAICDEIARRFGKDELLSIRAMVLQALMRKVDAIRAAAPTWGGVVRTRDISSYSDNGNGSSGQAVLDDIERRFGQDTDPVIRRLYIESLVVHGPPLRGRSVHAKAIRALDDRVRLLQEQGDHTAAAAAVHDAIGQGFGPESDYAVALYLTRKGILLASQGQYKAAIAFYNEVERRFNGDDHPEIRTLFGNALKAHSVIRGWSESSETAP